MGFYRVEWVDRTEREALRVIHEYTVDKEPADSHRTDPPGVDIVSTG